MRRSSPERKADRRTLTFAAFTLALLSSVPSSAAKIGEPAGSFTMTTLDGQKIRSEDLKGKVVVLNYWATWCGPCRREMPLLSLFSKKLRPNGLEIYSITVDEPPKKAMQDVERALTYPLVTSLHGKGYGVKDGVPTNYVIDRSGRLRYAKAGALDLGEMNNVVIPLLNEPAP